MSVPSPSPGIPGRGGPGISTPLPQRPQVPQGLPELCGRRSQDRRVSGLQQAAGREAGAGVECLYRDLRAASFSFASLSDHRKTPFDLLSDILALNS